MPGLLRPSTDPSPRPWPRGPISPDPRPWAGCAIIPWLKLREIVAAVGLRTFHDGHDRPIGFCVGLAAAPVVALGAALGAIAVARPPRAPTLLTVSAPCLVKFMWTPIDQQVGGGPGRHARRARDSVRSVSGDAQGRPPALSRGFTRPGRRRPSPGGAGPGSIARDKPDGSASG